MQAPDITWGPLVTGLLNLGGIGAFAALLLMLHREAIAAFREELREERRANADALREERKHCEERHHEVMQCLTRIESTIKPRGER